ncbi:hypothetical protein UF33_00115, partial [Vibrio parahaemolyticus]|uniref:hypothetical protein n=1 Tax=Vibrio parahaemolyticus TaxID=670 RepID=UPI00062B284B
HSNWGVLFLWGPLPTFFWCFSGRLSPRFFFPQHQIPPIYPNPPKICQQNPFTTASILKKRTLTPWFFTTTTKKKKRKEVVVDEGKKN